MGATAILSVAFHSLRYRLGGVVLTCVSVALSVFVLLGVEHVREEARSSFASTVSGVDLIVGARTTEVNLLLLSIFRIGNATANVTWESVEEISEQEQVDWIVPMSLGDSHRGFRVVGTTAEFFDRYRHGRDRELTFAEGRAFDEMAEVVVGARVAQSLGYGLGDSLILSHGVADTSFLQHDDAPFSVVGRLSTSGTPVDNALFVSLEAIDEIHADAAAHDDEDVHDEADAHDEDGHALDEADGEDDHTDAHDAPLDAVTALLLGLNSPMATFKVQRWINDYKAEPMLAILPGVALAQLWELLGTVEDVLRGISVLVLVSSLFGLNAMLLASMRERRREIEILRSIGAPSLFIVGLLVIESLLIVTIGVVVAIAGLLATIGLINGPLADQMGLTLSWQLFGPSSTIVLGLIFLSALVLSLLPAWRAYRLSRVGGPTPA